jgi:hypothetical protein
MELCKTAKRQADQEFRHITVPGLGLKILDLVDSDYDKIICIQLVPGQCFTTHYPLKKALTYKIVLIICDIAKDKWHFGSMYNAYQISFADCFVCQSKPPVSPNDESSIPCYSSVIQRFVTLSCRSC